MNPYWGPWIVASINDWIKNNSYLAGIPLYFESDEHKSPENYAKLHGYWGEVRIDGPVWNQHAKLWNGRFEINILFSVVKNQTTNIYLPRILAGKAEAAYARSIPIYKYGPADDPENDGSLFDCISQTPFRGTDNAIVTGFFGQVEPFVPMDQISIESHYIFEREAD